MQDLQDLSVEDDSSQLEDALLTSPELLGRECQGCFRVLAWKFFKKDSSYREGYRTLCHSCESAPRLSINEHTVRLQEANRNNHAVRRQRFEEQEEYRKDDARVGHRLHVTEFLRRVKKYLPNLFVIDGGVQGDLALFVIYPGPQPRLDGQDFEYLTYISEGWSNEFSTFEWNNETDTPIREKWNGGRGWRTVLLRLIKRDLITEEQALKEFGPAEGEGSRIYNKEIFKHRNRNAAPAA